MGRMSTAPGAKRHGPGPGTTGQALWGRRYGAGATGGRRHLPGARGQAPWGGGAMPAHAIISPAGAGVVQCSRTHAALITT